MTRIVLDIDDNRWKVSHLARVMRSAQSEFLSELAVQVDTRAESPLIVLDLGDRLRREYVVEILRENRHSWTHAVADQIEAQTKSPKPEEPQGIGATVLASQVGECDGSERTWVRFRLSWTECWIDSLEHIRDWSDLEVVTP